MTVSYGNEKVECLAKAIHSTVDDHHHDGNKMGKANTIYDLISRNITLEKEKMGCKTD